MAYFGVDSALGATGPEAGAPVEPRGAHEAEGTVVPDGTAARGPHPSAPIPVQGPAVGSSVRVELGDGGPQVFPLILGGAEFGWNVDLESSHAILDAHAELGGNAVHTSDSFA